MEKSSVDILDQVIKKGLWGNDIYAEIWRIIKKKSVQKAREGKCQTQGKADCKSEAKENLVF